MTKQLRYLCTLLLCMIASVGWVKADTTYSLTPNNEKTGSNATSYITTLTEFTYAGVSWKMNQWNPSTLQVKTNQGSAASEFRFYNTSAFPGKIKQVVIKFSALTLSNTSTTGFMFVGGTSEVTATTGGTNGTWDSNKKTITWTPNATDNYTYFAFYQNGKVATGTNKLAVEDAIVVTYETSGGNGTENNPYSVAQALANAPSTGTSDYVYVKGIVSKFYADDIMSDGTNYRYYISDDGATNNQLLVYQGKKSNTDAFSSVDDLRTGDLVVIYGQLKKYSSVTEFEPGNYIVSLKRELANANLSFSETSYTTTLGEDFTAPTLTNPYGLPVSYASSNEDVATVANDGTVTLVGVGETTITASSEATSTYAAGSASYTLTVEAAPTQLVTVDEKGNITFDLSDNGWGFATSSTNAGTSEATFSNNGYDIKVYAPNAYYYYSEGNALLMGKSGAYLILPEFDFDVSRIEVTGSSKAGTNVKQNIFVGDNAVSTETTGAKDITNIYDISGNYQKAGNIYVLKVTSAHNTQISSIKVIKKIAAAVETPTFNVATGTYFEAQSVEISCATDGTTIHYTTDGTDPTATSTEYTEPISISATTTLKAIAVKGEATSAVASATYTFCPIYTKFDDANKAATSDGAKVRIKTDAYVVYKNGSYTYLRDGNRFGLLLYGNNELEVGSRLVNAVIEGTLYTYNGLPEVKDYSINQSSTEYGYRTNVRVVDAATLKANPLDYVSQYVMVLPAVFDSDFTANTSSSSSATNATFKVGETELVVRDNFKLGCSAEAEKEYSVAGFVNIYNSTIQLYPTSTNDILEINDDYTFVKVTDKKQLAPGNEFVLLSSDNYYASGDTRYFVLGNGENLDGIGYKRIAGAVVRRNQDNTALIGKDAMVLTLGGTEGAYSFHSEKGYLTCVSEENVVSGNTSTVNVIKYADNEDKTLKISDDFQVLRDGSKLQMIPYTTDEFTWANNYNSAYLYVKKNHKLLPAAPTFSPEAGTVDANQRIVITAEEGCKVKYTIGETTTTSDGNTAYINVTETTSITAVAVKDGLESEPVSATYTIPNPNDKGQVNNPYTVADLSELANGLNGKLTYTVYVKGIIAAMGENTGVNACTFFISDDGSNASTFKIDGSTYMNHETFEGTNRLFVGDEMVIAINRLYNNPTDGIGDHGDYIKQRKASAPVISVAGGEYTAEQSVEIICANEAATVYYTLDGSTPTKESSVYESAITISESATLKAIAWLPEVSRNNNVDVAESYSDVATATYTIETPVVEPSTPVEITEGFYTIKNLGNEKFVNVAGRKTVTFVDADATATAAGTVLKVESNDKGQVQVLRSQAIDLPGYADKAMKYVPEVVQLVVNKLHAEGSGAILGENGLDALMKKFDESFDYHLYTEQAEGGIRIYGKTPSMRPVVEFYNENKDNVDAKLPMLEDFINDAINKILDKTGGRGSSILVPFSLLTVWENMGGTASGLTKPENDATKLTFLQDVLRNEQNVWDFAYHTAMIYWGKVKEHPRYDEFKGKLGDFAKYIDKIEYIRPNVKYYLATDGSNLDVLSQDNELVKTGTAALWELTSRTDFQVTFDEKNVLNGKYYTTLYTDFAYTLPEGVKAYKVTKVSDAGVAVKVALESVPAQTPVLLESESAGAKTLTLNTDEGTAPTDNILVGADAIINEYDINESQVVSLFEFALEVLGESTYNEYLAKYEHLMDRNSGTVNNKFFFGLTTKELGEGADEEGLISARSLAMQDNLLGFYENWDVSANHAFLLNKDYDPVKLFLKGDIDRDGDVDNDDLKALIKIILGTDTEEDNYDYDAANVNGDENENPDIADVTALVNILK